MAAPLQSVSAELAQGVADLLNDPAAAAVPPAAGFSLDFEAIREWAPASAAEDLEATTVLVVPAMRQVSQASRATKRHVSQVDVTVERQLGGQTGELEREDELAAIAQEIEDFLGNPDNQIVTPSFAATPTEVTTDWDREALLTERVFRTVISITYTLFR